MHAVAIGAGRWVLRPRLAAMLAAAGASVERWAPGLEWPALAISDARATLTYMAALLRDGARVEDWRRIGQDDDGGRVTALHHAVRARCLRRSASCWRMALIRVPQTTTG